MRRIVAIYKLTALSRKEIEAMLNLEIQETQVYKEIKEEGREKGREEGQLEMATLVAKDLLKTAMPVEEIARITRLPVAEVLRIQNEETQKGN
ncbi:MAG: hypothetical protein AAFQ74_16855 [Cyanobacteria bacterium J06623_4]